MRINFVIKGWLQKQKAVTVISGYFAAPIYEHPGYRDYIESAFSLGNPVLMIVSNRKQFKTKYGKVYHGWRTICAEYPEIMPLISLDRNGTQCYTLTEIRKYCENVIFYKDGSEYDKTNLPESKVEGIQFVFGVHKKIASSSEILGIKKIKER